MGYAGPCMTSINVDGINANKIAKPRMASQQARITIKPTRSATPQTISPTVATIAHNQAGEAGMK